MSDVKGMEADLRRDLKYTRYAWRLIFALLLVTIGAGLWLDYELERVLSLNAQVTQRVLTAKVPKANLRGHPSMDGNVIGALEAGAKTAVLGNDGPWINIQLQDGLVAWVHESVVSVGEVRSYVWGDDERRWQSWAPPVFGFLAAYFLTAAAYVFVVRSKHPYDKADAEDPWIARSINAIRISGGMAMLAAFVLWVRHDPPGLAALWAFMIGGVISQFHKIKGTSPSDGGQLR